MKITRQVFDQLELHEREKFFRSGGALCESGGLSLQEVRKRLQGPGKTWDEVQKMSTGDRWEFFVRRNGRIIDSAAPASAPRAAAGTRRPLPRVPQNFSGKSLPREVFYRCLHFSQQQEFLRGGGRVRG